MTARQWIEENLDSVLIADGFDGALLGYAYSPGRGYTAVYDREQCIRELMARGMSEEEAEEWFEYNTEGAWVGPGTPVFLWRIPPGKT
jgi:hypothetical protein